MLHILTFKNYASSIVQVKDCKVTCNPEMEGPGCNTGLQRVAQKFSTRSVRECFQCEYVQAEDGQVSGNEKCGKEITGNDIPSIQCPVYADSACFWAASFHKDFTGSTGGLTNMGSTF